MRWQLEVAAAPYKWEALDPKPVTTNGYRVESVPPAIGRTLRMYRDESWLRPTIAPLPTGSSFIPDLQGLHIRRTQARGLAANASWGKRAIDISEHEHFAKWTLQSGAYPGWDVQEGGMGKPGGGSIAKGLASIRDRLFSDEAFLEAASVNSPYPVDTNSGAPFYTSDPLTKVWAALCANASSSLGDLRELFAYAARLNEAPEEIHAVTFSRTGPLSKEQIVREYVGGYMHEVAVARGAACRRRDVKGLWSGQNLYIQRRTNAAKTALQREHRFSHRSKVDMVKKLQRAVLRVARYWNISPRSVRVIEDDISGFDKDVRRIHQEEVSDTLYYYWAPSEREVWLDICKAPVLSAPLYSADEGFMYTREAGGETTSGEIGTTTNGTVINASSVEESVPYGLGVDFVTSRRLMDDGAWDYWCWGDDTLLIVPPKFDVDGYIARRLENGFTCKARDGNVFLMTFLDYENDTYYPLASRVFQQTTANERAAKTRSIELLGLFARSHHLDKNPYGSKVWTAIRQGPNPLDSYGITTRDELHDVLRDPGVAAELKKDLKSRRNILREWLSRSDRATVDRDVWTYLVDLFGGELKLMMDDLRRDFVGEWAADATATRARELAAYLASGKEGDPPAWLGNWKEKVQHGAEEGDDSEGTPLWEGRDL